MIMVFVIVLLLVIAGIGGFYTYKYLQLKKFILPTKSNIILREILKLGLYKYDDIKDGAWKIISTLRKYYQIDYCTLFKTEGSDLVILASNVDSMYHDYIKAQAEILKSELGTDYQAQIVTSDDYLNYYSAGHRKIKYNYFILLMAQNELIGAIYIENRDTGTLKVEKEFFSVVIENITIVLQNLTYYETIKNMAMRDGLTGVYNRNYLEQYLKNLLSRRKPFSVAIFDIDHFKKFNDTYGHLFGDLALKEVSSFVKRELPKHGEIFRFGGEEFVIILDDKNSSASYEKIEQIRKGIESIVIRDKRSEVSVTCSFGFYHVKDDFNASPSEILKKADKALYASKSNGRNKVTMYEESLS